MATTDSNLTNIPIAGKTFDEVLVSGSKDELNQLKTWLFAEGIRIEEAIEELRMLEARFISERSQFREEMKNLSRNLDLEKKRQKSEAAFFDKKMEILKDGFAKLDADKRKLEKERLGFLAQKENIAREVDYGRYDTVEYLFRGTSNPIALKKRYKDLLKVFHPDNFAGDHEMVLGINKYYEKMSSQYEFDKEETDVG
ncbi:MAG: hypothetical protein LBC96_01830 [Lachnospiraceae bacterium]|jgi:seryl-tRNA synthetase|nr:hypothetical protein [Lachnospiraceae bacterium]